MAILDSPGGNANAQIQAGPLDRPIKAYQWVCTNPGCPNPNQIGRIEDGCSACGAGADAKAGSPLAPTDFNCAACKGTGTVERKCGLCDGTGMLGAPQLGEPPPGCDKCGGAGTVAMGCARCDGSGIDPNPEQKIPTLQAVVGGGVVTAPVKTPPSPTPQAGIFKLPSIDEEPAAVVTSPDTVIRYRLIRYEGPADVVARTIDNSLNGCWVEESGTSMIGIEIDAPKAPGLHDALQQASKRGPAWPARKKY